MPSGAPAPSDHRRRDAASAAFRWRRGSTTAPACDPSWRNSAKTPNSLRLLAKHRTMIHNQAGEPGLISDGRPPSRAPSIAGPAHAAAPGIAAPQYSGSLVSHPTVGRRPAGRSRPGCRPASAPKSALLRRLRCFRPRRSRRSRTGLPVRHRRLRRAGHIAGALERAAFRRRRRAASWRELPVRFLPPGGWLLRSRVTSRGDAVASRLRPRSSAEAREKRDASEYPLRLAPAWASSCAVPPLSACVLIGLPPVRAGFGAPRRFRRRIERSLMPVSTACRGAAAPEAFAAAVSAPGRVARCRPPLSRDLSYRVTARSCTSSPGVAGVGRPLIAVPGSSRPAAVRRDGGSRRSARRPCPCRRAVCNSTASCRSGRSVISRSAATMHSMPNSGASCDGRSSQLVNIDSDHRRLLRTCRSSQVIGRVAA